MKVTLTTKMAIETLSPLVAILDGKAEGAMRCLRLKVGEDGERALEVEAVSDGGKIGILAASMTATISGNPAKTGQLYVAGKDFFEALKALNSPTVTLEYKSPRLHITGERASFKMVTLDGEDFPRFAKVTETAYLRLSFGDLVKLIDTTQPMATEKDSSNLLFAGLYLSVHSKDDQAVAEMIGCHEFGVGIARVPCEVQGNFVPSLVPAALWAQIAKLDLPDESLVLIASDERDPDLLKIVLPGYNVRAIGLSGSYPADPVRRFAQMEDTRIAFDKAEMKRALTGALLVRDMNTTTHLACLNGGLHLETRGFRGTHEAEVAVKTTAPFERHVMATDLAKVIEVCGHEAICFVTRSHLIARGDNALRAIPFINKK